MAFLTALVLIDAPASALNNSDQSIENARTDNTTGVKFIQKRGGGKYPYVSAQAYRYWLRRALTSDPQGWQMSPVYREEKVAYTDSNPLIYWDDDLLGYMRAPGKSATAKKAQQDNPDFAKMTPLGEDTQVVTRLSPLRVSTLVAIAPVTLTSDFGVMARQEGDPTPFEHQFYRATLQGLLSLDLHDAGTFTISRRSGHQNLDNVRIEMAKQQNLEPILSEDGKTTIAYRLSIDQRIQRVRRLIEAIPLVQGGAKQTLHYTDVSPVVAIAAITKYGNHPFNYLFGEKDGELVLDVDSFERVVAAAPDQFESPICVGWRPGFASNQEDKLNNRSEIGTVRLFKQTPIEIFRTLSAALAESPNWLN
ncbi:MAG: type I-B CRISPR-associated protein Cas7/Cst2/DevR [Aggregatilineales bacterium]